MTDSTPDSEKAADLGPGKRERLVAAATELLHRQGAERTTLSDIAEVANVPPGNVYYYFKTKDELIAAVVDAHVQLTSATLAGIDGRHRTPKGRLKALVREFADQKQTIVEYGCPLGSLCSEIDKRTDGFDFAAAKLMRVPIQWAEDQFRQLGRRDAEDLAVSLISTYQGSALLTNTLRDPEVLSRVARRLERWIDTL